MVSRARSVSHVVCFVVEVLIKKKKHVIRSGSDSDSDSDADDADSAEKVPTSGGFF